MGEKLTKEDLINDIRKLGVRNGDMLHLKVSMRSIGYVEGGANTLLQALLDVVGEEGTLVSDAFISTYPLPLEPEQEKLIADDYTPSYAGAFANAMIKHPRMHRSKHPVQKYAAIGKDAERLCHNHTPESGGYDLLHQMAEEGAKNLTIGKKVAGVGTTHVAIDLLGFKRKQINRGIHYRDEDGIVKLAGVNWNGGCAKGFPKFIPHYFKQGAVLADGNVGEARGLLTSMKRTLEIELDILKKDPAFFFCGDKTCYSCQMTWDHSPKNPFSFYPRWMMKNIGSLSFSRIRNLLKINKKSANA
ncbi:MAG TPA: AAC(3) family N-acetyltransferase [Bacteroidales bacterium]|nr:AAC(3) family N-acetyltransferase [Bacteroidales bacterium]